MRNLVLDAPMNNLKESSIIFGKNMRAARKEMGLTAEQVGKFLSLSTAYIGLIERGERTPSFEVFLKICNFFGEDYTDMLTPKPFSANQSQPDYIENSSKNQKQRKQKTLQSMLNTFNEVELDHIIGTTKNFKAYCEQIQKQEGKALSQY